MESMGGHAPDTDKLADELRQLMSLRSRSSVRDRACPEFDRLLQDQDRDSRDRRYLARARLIDAAATAIHDPAHSNAARSLLGSGDGRWRTVAQRGAEAAAQFGCGWDAYRRRRTNSTSQLDDTLQALATKLILVAGGVDGTVRPGAGVGQPSAPNQTPEPSPGPRGGERPTSEVREVVIARVATPVGEQAVVGGPIRVARRRWQPRVAALAALAVVLSAAWFANRPQDSSDTTEEGSSACDILDQQVGALPDGADESLQLWSDRFRAFARTLPPASVQCAGVMEQRHGLIIQPVASPGPMGIGALVAADHPTARIVRLDYLEYFTYRTNLDRYGVEMVGTPVRRADLDDTTVVMLTRGAIVGEAPPVSFLVMGAVWREWNRRGGLDGEMGRPISAMRDEKGERIQDFEHGRLVMDLSDPERVEWRPMPNGASALPLDLADTLVEAEDGTAWYVGKDLVRHWVPTSNDFNCTLSLGRFRHRSVPAQAIATLRSGEPYRCR